MDLIHSSVCWVLNTQQNPFAVNSCSNPSSSLRRSLKGRRGGERKEKEKADWQSSQDGILLKAEDPVCSHLCYGVVHTYSREGEKAENHYASKSHPQPSIEERKLPLQSACSQGSQVGKITPASSHQLNGFQASMHSKVAQPEL